jgi:hypothetical protein
MLPVAGGERVLTAGEGGSSDSQPDHGSKPSFDAIAEPSSHSVLTEARFVDENCPDGMSIQIVW